MAHGLKAPDKDHAEIKSISARLFKGAVEDGQLGAALNAALTPDLAITPVSPDVAFIHRTTPAGEIYFIVNSSNIKRSLEGTFRVSGMEPEIWDPLNGKTSDTPALRRDAKTVTPRAGVGAVRIARDRVFKRRQASHTDCGTPIGYRNRHQPGMDGEFRFKRPTNGQVNVLD